MDDNQSILHRNLRAAVADPLIDRVIAQLRGDEGERLTVYQDHLGYWTIGIGVLVDARKPGAGITPEESAYLARNRVHARIASLSRALPWFDRLDAARQAALLNMSYQLGVEGLLAFAKALAAIRDERWDLAHTELLDSLWAKQTPERARRVARQIQTGEWQS
jgi:lysozyme